MSNNKEVEILGKTIDQKLSFNQHIKTFCEKTIVKNLSIP